MMWWTRFFEAINFRLEESISINQTVSLMKKETPKLVTKLRHIDVHQMWLQQQVQAGSINVKLDPILQIEADCFTKILTA